MFDHITRTAEELAESFLEDCKIVKPEQVGLDARSAHKLFMGEDFLAVHVSQVGNMRYYGGFQYVEEDDQTQIHHMVFFSKQSARVEACFDHMKAQ